MRKISVLTTSLKSVLKNLIRMLSLAWEASHFITAGYYLTAGVGAIFPIITSYTYKLLVDYIIASQGIAPTIPFILIAILGGRYILEMARDFIFWGLKGIYFDYLFRYRVQIALNYKFYKKVSQLDIAHLEDPKTEDLITKASDTFNWRPPDFLRSFSNLFSDFVGYITSFIIIIPYGPVMPFVITALTLPRLYMRARFGKLQWSIYGSGAPEVRKLYYLRWLLTHKSSILESRIFQSSKELLNRFQNTQEYLYDINSKPVKGFLKVANLPKILETGVVFIFAYLKLPEVLNGSMSVGDFTFFISLLDRIVSSAADMILNFGDMYENNLYVNHYFDVLNLPQLIQDPIAPVSLGKEIRPPRIEFRNVSFSYPGNKKRVLRKVNFIIEPGENFAVVGHNGAGKTTIVKLLCRFYDVTEGEILINGVNIKDVTRAEWYKYLGTLFQEFVHYDFTVRENIMLGNPSLNDEERMKKAAKMSGADQFIEGLPKKYNQVLGRQFEGGMELSQGQWQKLAISRAFYEDAPVLILDEPTSAIDADAEYEIFKNLQKFYNDKTLFLISHRFSTVRNADKIVVLQKGKIVEEGSHEDLIKENGVYANMFKKQASGYR